MLRSRLIKYGDAATSNVLARCHNDHRLPTTEAREPGILDEVFAFTMEIYKMVDCQARRLSSATYGKQHKLGCNRRGHHVPNFCAFIVQVGSSSQRRP